MRAAKRFPGLVLSVQQPWAWAILHGGKDVENRRWRTAHRGRIWIHASRSELAGDVDDVVAMADGDDADALASYRENRIFGAIVGSVEVFDCVLVDTLPEHSELLRNHWLAGPYAWLLHSPVPCDPWPMPGRLGLWRVR